MKSMISLLGILLIILGIVGLTYQGISYTKTEKVAQLGNLEITADHEKTVYFPPLASGAALLAGIVLVVVSRMSGKS